MDETGLLRSLLWPGTPLWAIALMAGVLAFKTWPYILERWNERMRDKTSERAQDWTRIREEVGRLDTRVQALEIECTDLRDKVRQCEERESGWIQRAIKAEAQLDGLGEVRQASAVAAAEVRLDAIDKAKKGKPE